MNESLNTNSPSVSATRSSGIDRPAVPDTAMLPSSDKTANAGQDLLKTAVQGAHNTIERLANSAAPAVQHLSESVAAARVSLQAKPEQLRELRDDWVDGARTKVRANPLVAVAAALAVGVLMARLARSLR